MAFDETYDVVIVGGGNAGFSAATTAAQLGSRVLLVEKAPQSDAGGNTFFTAGAYRTCFGGLDDLLPIIYKEDGTKGLPRELVERIDMKAYTPADFHADIKRVCKGRADPALANVLVDGSRDAVQWIADLGGKWALSFNRQAFEIDGRFKFWGGMVMTFLGKNYPSVCGLMTYYCDRRRQRTLQLAHQSRARARRDNILEFTCDITMPRSTDWTYRRS
jgi:hypothetical protein